MDNSIHEKYIERCFQLAKKGIGKTSPNPLVGAVIVKNGTIIGEGYHEYFGGPHAEVNAFNNCSDNPENADLYVNLEPCSHTDKKTPPCAPLVISKKVKRLIISNLDPNPKVNGAGIKLIREAGIEVITGVLEEKGKELNKFFFNFVKEKLPYTTLKIAVSADGFITQKEGTQTWITGIEAKKYVHKLRAQYDAVLVGANTVNIDNPKLNVREVEGINPIRILIDGKLSVNTNSFIVQSANKEKTILFTSRRADNDKKKILIDYGVTIIELDSGETDIINLKAVLTELGKLNISSLLVEGGSEIFTQFLSQNLTDELHIIKSPKKFHQGVPAFNNKIELPEASSEELLGKDKLSVYKLK